MKNCMCLSSKPRKKGRSYLVKIPNEKVGLELRGVVKIHERKMTCNGHQVKKKKEEVEKTTLQQKTKERSLMCKLSPGREVRLMAQCRGKAETLRRSSDMSKFEL